MMFLYGQVFVCLGCGVDFLFCLWVGVVCNLVVFFSSVTYTMPMDGYQEGLKCTADLFVKKLKIPGIGMFASE